MYLTNILNTVNYIFGLNILTGQRGINYYNEAHKSKLNKFVHLVCMPITVYGMTIWIPSLINYNSMNNNSMNNSMNSIFYLELGLFLFYFNHYVNIKKNVALWLIVMYLPVVYMGYNYLYFNRDNYENMIYGLKISGGSLLIQETLGHYLGGDIPSRKEGVLNAILYAIYSSVEYSLSEFEYSIEYFRDNYINRFWKDDDKLKVISIKVEIKKLSIFPLINKLNELDLDIIHFNNVYSYYTYNTLRNFYLSKGFNVVDLNKSNNYNYYYYKILFCFLLVGLLYYLDYNNYIYISIYYIIICYNWIIEIYPFNRYNKSGIIIVSRYPIIDVNKNDITVNINNNLTKIVV